MCKNLWAIVVCLAIWCGVGNVWASVSVVTPDVSARILNSVRVDAKEIRKYKNIFSALKKNNVEVADRLVAKLDSDVLLGYVLAEKYLATKYVTSPDELQKWLESYADLVPADRIAKLAKRKGVEIEYIEVVKNPKDNKLDQKYLGGLSSGDRKFLVGYAQNFRKYIASGKTLRARNVLENKRFKKLAPEVYWDSLAATLAMKYLTDNYDTKALEWAKKAAKRHNSGMATWVAGLASWRKKNYEDAASFFVRLGVSKNSDEWLKAAALFWAARALEEIGDLPKVEKMLTKAVKYKYTFYGILAAFKLGQKFDFDFDSDIYINDFEKHDYVNEMLASKAIVRALVLLKVGQSEWAEKELFAAYDDMTDKQKEAVILLAHQYGLHSLAIGISRHKNIMSLQGNYEKEIYPLPKWSDKQNWVVDKALILALIRQESAFKQNATSRVGARGLMQLMPNTAYHISKDRSVKRNKDKLFDLNYNLELGQKYVSYLLKKTFIKGNLFFMLAAYNGGPGNLLKWQKNARFNDDPLLFIEVLPAAETRIYIERVMANYWIYNYRFGNHSQSLEQLINGEWPVFEDGFDFGFEL